MKRFNILIVIFLCLLIPVWLQVTRRDKAPDRDFQAVSVTQTAQETAPKEEEKADIIFSIAQVMDKPPATLDQVHINLSLVTESKGPYWELLSYAQVPWEQSTFQLELVSQDGQKFPIDVLERDFKKNHKEASLILEPGQALSANINLSPYLESLEEKEAAELRQAFLRNELACEAKVRTRIAVPQPGEDVRYAKLESTVSCPLLVVHL
jgi:hypothetical protein